MAEGSLRDLSVGADIKVPWRPIFDCSIFIPDVSEVVWLGLCCCWHSRNWHLGGFGAQK